MLINSYCVGVFQYHFHITLLLYFILRYLLLIVSVQTNDDDEDGDDNNNPKRTFFLEGNPKRILKKFKENFYKFSFSKKNLKYSFRISKSRKAQLYRTR